MEKSITSTEYATFLRELRAARQKAGLTQAELAARVGETQSFISKCERGERRIDVIELRTFCEVFGLPVGRFVKNLEGALRGLPGQRRRRSEMTSQAR